MTIKTYVWQALSSVAFWSHDGLKTRFAIGAQVYFTDDTYAPGYSFTLSIQA